MQLCDLGGRVFRADAAYAIPAIYERLEEARFFYAIRLPANNVLRDDLPQSRGPVSVLVHDEPRRYGRCGRRSGSGWRSRPLDDLGSRRAVAQG